jgi:hypothetical protein
MVELLIKCVTLKLSISEVAIKMDACARVGRSEVKLPTTVIGYLSLLQLRQRWS